MILKPSNLVLFLIRAYRGQSSIEKPVIEK